MYTSTGLKQRSNGSYYFLVTNRATGVTIEEEMPSNEAAIIQEVILDNQRAGHLWTWDAVNKQFVVKEHCERTACGICNIFANASPSLGGQLIKRMN